MENILCTLTDFIWLWIHISDDADATERSQDEPVGQRCWDAAHLYQLATIQYLMADGFLLAIAQALPFGHAPSNTRPASDLTGAFHSMERC